MGFSMFLSSENDVVHHSSPYTSVDCTLSLGTPSTRLSNEEDDRRFSSHNSNTLGWDFLHGGKKGGGAGGGGGNNLLPRRCANCDTTSTPLWRNGPRGPKSLCNACGIRFKKEERRATARNSTSGGGSTAAGAPTSNHHGGEIYYYNNNNNNNNHYASSSPWVHHHQHNTQRAPYCSPANNEYSFVDDVRDSDHDVATDPYLSWRLNVADRTSFVHDFAM